MSKESFNFFDTSIKKIIDSKPLSSDNNNFLNSKMDVFNKSNTSNFNSNSKFFNNLKPKKEFKLAGKPVQVFNNNPIPNKKLIENTYKQIPDDTKVPLQFMTRKQYYQTYAKNQECVNGRPFNKEQKQQFFKGAKQRYSNIIGRYTTESNPYYPPAVVVFNDKDNLPNIKGQNFKDLAWHEFGHEYVEEKQIKMPLQKEELFADTLAMNKSMQKQVRVDMRYNNIPLLKTQLQVHTGVLRQDVKSKNDTTNIYTWQSPDKEIVKNPEPARDSSRKRMTPGRSTGWTGTGIYGYTDKIQATREAEQSPNLYKDRKLYKIKVEKPLVFPFKGYDKFMQASKHHRMLNQDSFINNKPLVGQVLREYNEAGIKTTEKQLFNTVVNSEKNNMLPSTLLLKEQGFDSVIADRENNTYMTGSVVLGRKGDFQNKLVETSPNEITKDEYDLYDWNKHKQKEPSYQSESKKRLIADALRKTSEREDYQDYSDFYDEKRNEAYLDKYKDPKNQQELLSKYEQIKVQEQKEKDDFYKRKNLSKEEEELKMLLLKHEILNKG